MPNRDGTGPSGQGSLTGRGAGNCTKQTGDGRLRGRGIGRRGTGRGIGRSGAGRGLGNGTGIAPVPRQSWFEDQISALQSAIQNLSERLDSSNKE